MTNKRNSVKKSLLVNLLTLLVCSAMLVTSTFAWFTDSVTSGVNTIVAGNLDVELEYSKDMQTWKTVEAATELFDDVKLWEPGATSVVYLRFRNAGNLAFKYNIAVKVDSETSGTNVEGKTFKLSDKIKFGQVNDVTAAYASREAAINAVEANAKPIKEVYQSSGIMYKDTAAKVIALVVYMPTEVGNDANYRGTNIPTIEMGIKLDATQVTSESETDSFGSDYDKAAQIEEPALPDLVYDDEAKIVTINSAGGYLEYMNGEKAWYAAKLGADIDFGGTTVATMTLGVPSGGYSFDGQGHTMQNATVVGGFFEEYNESLNIKDVTFKNITVNAATGNDFGAGVVATRVRNATTENVVIENCTVDATAAEKQYAGAFCGTLNGTLKGVTVNNCTITGKNAGGVVGFASAEGVDVLLENCFVKNTTVNSTRNGSTTVGAGAVVGRATNPSGTLNVNGCSFDNVAVSNADGDLTAVIVGDTAGYTITVDGEQLTK